MIRQVLMGTAAGAVGTVALNFATYVDMAVRARPSSNVPAKIVAAGAEKLGVDLSGEGSADANVQNRRTGLGALSGYMVGLGVGTTYGLLRLRVRDVPQPLAAVGLGTIAMAASDVPATLLGVTDPRTWSRTSWAADIIPHLAYGTFTAISYDAFTDGV